MWSEQFLVTIGPNLFNSQDKVSIYFRDFVKQVLTPQWVGETDRFSSLIDFRDYAEDTLALLAEHFKVEVPTAVTIDKLIKSLRAHTDSTIRKKMTVAFLEENVSSLRPSMIYAPFVEWSINAELKKYFELACGLGKIRPVLSCSVDTIDSVTKKITSDLTYDDCLAFAKDLGVTSLWPVLALCKAHQDGEVEEIFLHVPMPKVFGAPSCVRNSLSRKKVGDFSKNTKSYLNLKQSVIAGKNSLCWNDQSDWTIKENVTAHLVAALPGTKRSVWCLDPQTMKAVIYQLDPFRILLEFDLPRDREPNWIDCQRDNEGSLVLLWGHINHLTGALHSQNMSAIHEEALFSSSDEVLAPISDMQNRRKLGSKIDWRDHGNLLSVHHQVVDVPGPIRKWAHNYDIVFADTILLSLETEGRPIESIFGCPNEMILLSPLSASQSLQYWIVGESGEHTMKETSKLPKCPEGQWTSLTVSI